MKNKCKRFLCMLLTVCMLSSSLVALAATQASAYLSSYSADLTAGSNGKIYVTVDVSGTGYMTDIGATDIYIYESTDNVDFTRVSSFSSDRYPRMLGSGTIYVDTPITYAGTPGCYYIAEVYFYAANSTGSDSRSYTTVSCRAIS